MSDTLTTRKGKLYIENIPLDTIAEETGTPCYIYSASHIRTQYNRLKAAMDKALPAGRQPLLCYACKANSHLAILALLNTLGSGLEVVSEGELIRGLKAGFDPEKIVSTGVGKTDNEIAAQLKAGLHQINVESLPELERINAISGSLNKTAAVVFRLNPDVSGGGHDKISTGRKHDKFGLDRDSVFRGFAMAENMAHVNAVGLSVHIGSQVFEVKTFKRAFEKFPALVTELRKSGHTIERLDIGGGFPIRYRNENLLDLEAYAEWVRDIILPLDTEIILEPGRFLVGNAGALLTKVLYVKETQDRSFLVVDAGMNDLLRPAIYDSWHSIEPAANMDRPETVYDIAGPVCESSDIFAKDRKIPEMKAGELAVIKSTGAYGFCMASNYNTRLLPAEILVDGDQYAVIRPRQTYEDLLAPEIIPDWI